MERVNFRCLSFSFVNVNVNDINNVSVKTNFHAIWNVFVFVFVFVFVTVAVTVTVTVIVTVAFLKVQI